ncbi:MAG: PDZ domain-containing protein [Acidobacteriota bacterium]
MNRFERIANPVVVTLVLCAAVYVYFFYVRGAPVLRSVPQTTGETENERNWEQVPPKENRVVAVAGTVQQLESPIVPRNAQNVTPLPNPLETPQGTSVAAAAAAPAAPNPDPLPSGPNPGAAATVPGQPVVVPDVPFIEGHWIGLETIPLTAAIAQANAIPPEVTGVLIDEVTLLSAAVGIVAGDVITAVNGKKVTDLKTFQAATKDVAQSNKASVALFSGGKPKTMMVVGTDALGVAQMEAAPMILATARSPHPYYGPCDRCHAIAKNGFNANQLLKDQGDALNKVAPNIRAGTLPPHRNRGKCTSCHVVIF